MRWALLVPEKAQGQIDSYEWQVRKEGSCRLSAFVFNSLAGSEEVRIPAGYID